MPATPIVGINALVKWTKSGGSEVTLKNQNWKLNIMNDVKKTSNTTDGIVRAIGLEDFEGTIEGYLDTSDKIEAAIYVGDTGTLKLYRSSTSFWSMSAVIMKIEEGTGTEEEDKYTISFAKLSGSLTKPT